MSTSLLAEFPELANLSWASHISRVVSLNDVEIPDRREDLEDLLSDPVYFQAIFHSLNQVKALYQAQAELGLANESIASQCDLLIAVVWDDHWYVKRQQSRAAGKSLFITSGDQGCIWWGQGIGSKVEGTREGAARSISGSPTSFSLAIAYSDKDNKIQKD
jgi:hypothetical protein